MESSCYVIPLLLVALLAGVATTAQVQPSRHSFRPNCADEHDKDLLSCTVTAVDCSINLEKLFPPTASNDGFPGEGHDLRIEPFAKATPRLGTGNGGQQQQHHQLLVDISWQTPPNNSTHALKAFLLEIEGESGRKHACFLLNVSGTNWSAESVAASPRLHFSTDSLFSFGQNYEIELYSLPERSPGSGASIHARFASPQNPHPMDSLSASNCSKRSSQFASKWTAGFRHIYVHSAARIMQVEFVGAPAQYCFEQYEVRLLDETGLELLYSGTVSVEEMNQNGSIILGTYNFTDLQYDKSYIPSVIPVERATDGRCLCPVFGTDPYDGTVVCSCVAADWKPVRMTRPDVLKLCPGCPTNGTSLLQLGTFEDRPVQDRNKAGILWILLLVFNALFLLLIFLLVIAYLRCRLNGGLPRKDQFRRIRFVTPGTKGGDSSQLCGPNASTAAAANNHSLAIRTNLTLGTVSASSSLNMPLIGNEEVPSESSMDSTGAAPLNVLIVYAHDCTAHEQAVLALAEFLRDQFHVNVQMDRWQLAQIEANLTDWLSASVVTADKVLVVNSAGAWERYRAKCVSQGRWAVERKEADLLDHMFGAHIDMALQHHSIVSARFGYTSTDQTLPMLQGMLQYILPDNICPLISALFGKNMRQDERLSLTTLVNCEPLKHMKDCISQMEQMCREQPNWLADTHQRIAHLMPGPAKQFITIVDETAEVIESEQTSEEAKLPLMPSFVEQTSAAGLKLDSGIFEWAGSDEDSNTGTSNPGQSSTMQELGEEHRLSVDDLEEQQQQECIPQLQEQQLSPRPEFIGSEDCCHDGDGSPTDSGIHTTDCMRTEQLKQSEREAPNIPHMLAAS